MSKRRRDEEEITQQIRVGREALDEALRESEAAAKRIQSSIPPGKPENEEEPTSEEPKPED